MTGRQPCIQVREQLLAADEGFRLGCQPDWLARCRPLMRQLELAYRHPAQGDNRARPYISDLGPG